MDKNMMEYQLGMYCLAFKESMTKPGTVTIHNTFWNGLEEILAEWYDKYHDEFVEHMRLEE